MSTAYQRRQGEKYLRKLKTKRKHVVMTKAAKAAADEAAATVKALAKLRTVKVRRPRINPVGPDGVRYRRTRKTLNREKARQLLLRRDGNKCGICGKAFVRAHSDGDWSMTIDHIQPLSKGGTHHIRNLRLAHQYCNSVRGNNTDDLQPRVDSKTQ